LAAAERTEHDESYSTSLVRKRHGTADPLLHLSDPWLNDYLDVGYSRGPAGKVKIAAFTLCDRRYMAAEPGARSIQP
jgi:hypothetical protein